MIGYLKHCTAAAVESWVRFRMREQNLPLVCLIPDQGSEFARLINIKSLTVYPCQPHRPWQKPTVKNTNGLIPNHIPKDNSSAISPLSSSPTSNINSITDLDSASTGKPPSIYYPAGSPLLHFD